MIVNDFNYFININYTYNNYGENPTYLVESNQTSNDWNVDVETVKARENSKTLWGVQAIAQYKAKHCLDYRPTKQAKMLMLKAIEKPYCDKLT